VAAELCFHLTPTDPAAAMAALGRAPHTTSEGHLAEGMARIKDLDGPGALPHLVGHGHRDDRRRLRLIASVAAGLERPRLRRLAVNGLKWLDGPDPTVGDRALALRRKKRDPTTSMREAEQLYREFPLAPQVRYTRALALLDTGDAQTGLDEFVSLFHDQPRLWGPEGVFHLREVSKVEETGLLVSPLRDLLEAQLALPDATPYGRGFLCAAVTEFTAEGHDPAWLEIGVRDLTHVLRLEPTALFARLLRAHLWLRLGRWRRAKDDLERVADVGDDFPCLWFHRGRLLALRGRPLRQIHAAFERAHRLDYDFVKRDLAMRLYPELVPYLKAPESQDATYWND
jgi:hypothetical protein